MAPGTGNLLRHPGKMNGRRSTGSLWKKPWHWLKEWAPEVSIFSHRDQKQMTAQDVLDIRPDELYGKD